MVTGLRVEGSLLVAAIKVG